MIRTIAELVIKNLFVKIAFSNNGYVFFCTIIIQQSCAVQLAKGSCS